MGQSIRELMTKDVVTSPSGTSVAEASRLMRDEDIGDIVVVDEDTVIGLVTDRDIVIRAMAEGRSPTETTVGDIASREIATVGPNDDVAEVVRTMRSQAVRRIPVVEDGRPVGVVSIGDLAIERDSDSALADISAAPPNK